jgi:steroid delta-isomerase-like uncharacterized protein
LFDAFSKSDVDRVEALASDDLELLDIATGETFRGKEGARRNAEGWFTPFPDVQVELVNLVVAGEWEVAEGIGRGTNTGPIRTPDGEIPATGRSMEARFCAISRVRDGKLVESRDYYDLGSIMQQLGLVPEQAATTA